MFLVSGLRDHSGLLKNYCRFAVPTFVDNILVV